MAPFAPLIGMFFFSSWVRNPVTRRRGGAEKEARGLRVNPFSLPVRGFRLPVRVIRLYVHVIRFPIHGFRFPVHAFPFTVDGFPFTVHGFLFTVHGFRFTVHGFRFTVHGFRFTVNGFSFCLVTIFSGEIADFSDNRCPDSFRQLPFFSSPVFIRSGGPKKFRETGGSDLRSLPACKPLKSGYLRELTGTITMPLQLFAPVQG